MPTGVTIKLAWPVKDCKRYHPSAALARKKFQESRKGCAIHVSRQQGAKQERDGASRPIFYVTGRTFRLFPLKRRLAPLGSYPQKTTMVTKNLPN
jgi:hypothetical protein